MPFGIKLYNVSSKAVLRLEEKIVQTPKGRARRTVITKPPAKPRQKRLFPDIDGKSTSSGSGSKVKVVSDWNEDPFIDDDRERLVLCDPVPLEVFQQVIEANSQVCTFDVSSIVIHFIDWINLGPAHLHQRISRQKI